MVGWTLSSPRNTVQKTAQASSWDAASSQTAMGETFCFTIIKFVSVKEVNVPTPKTVSNFLVRSAASDPAKGERLVNKKYSWRSPPSLGPWCGKWVPSP